MPNVLSKLYRQAGLLIVGGLLTATGYAASNITTGGTSVPEITSTGLESVRTYVANQEFNAFVSATGSSTLDYPATCVPNPLARLSPSQGSGRLFSLSLENISNPNGACADVVFTKNCSDQTGSGVLLIKNACTGTGRVAYLMGPLAATGALWNGADNIKVIINKDPTSSFNARLRGSFEDIAGE